MHEVALGILRSPTFVERMFNMNWRKLLLAAIAASSLLGGLAHAQSTLRIGLNDDPDGIDPTLSRSYSIRLVFAAVCDKLFDITPDVKIVPQLATGYTWDKDGMSVVIKLRPGVTSSTTASRSTPKRCATTSTAA
jgi:ABC-type transport system substrate-binding protein